MKISLSGIHFALDYLTANTRGLLDPYYKAANYLSAQNKDVIIIGGGDTGTDCLATSLRQGCKSVVQLEIMPEAPQERQTDNPWPENPQISKIDYGQEEAIPLIGKDPRIYLVMAKKFGGDKTGNVKEVHTVKIRWEKDNKGRFIPVEIPGTERIWPAQIVLLAMGFIGPEDTLINAFNLGFQLFSQGNMDNKFRTNIDNVFTAGDMRRGQSMVAWAIKEGRDAADELNKYLLNIL